VEFELHARNCSSLSSSGDVVQAYDMYGASAWETIPDILQMYGMCSYRDWFEYLEFVDPTNAEKRKNQGACGIDATSKSCDPAAFNAYLSQWWDTRRPYSQPGMLSLFETKKFQVAAHPCDRDYQHVDGMQGCSPVFSSASVAGWVDMDSSHRIELPPAEQHGTYAQTLRRDGYINMQGEISSFMLFVFKITNSPTCAYTSTYTYTYTYIYTYTYK
jgi:hypothetical protein